MACYADDLVKMARGEVGYIEKASNKDLDDKTANPGKGNWTKYARDLDAISFFNGKKNGYDWCAVFVCWCFNKAFGTANAKKLLCHPDKNSLGASCTYSMKYYTKKGLFNKIPAVGDQIFFKNSSGGASHTGIVYKVDKTYVYTVEGNTSSASGVVPNGGCVAEKKYKLSSASIAGYGHPKYDAKPVAKVTPEKVTVKKETTPEVKTPEYQCIHTVVKGDTLWGISKKYLGAGSKYTQIMKLNGKKTSLIKVGEKLKIPNK